MRWVCAALACVGMAGCGGGGPDSQEASGFVANAPASRVEADWNDIDAAVVVGASEAEMAVLSRNQKEDARERVFELKTVRDEPVWLVITRGPSAGETAGTVAELGRSAERTQGAGGVSESLTLRARVGRFGDPEAEQRLIRAVAERLRKLKGREWYPVD